MDYQNNGENNGQNYTQDYQPQNGYAQDYQPQNTYAQDYQQTSYNDMYAQGYQPTSTGATLEIEPSHHMRGVLGALIGTLIGGALWVFIGYLGFISGWIAILIFFLAQFFYTKFNKKLDTFGVIICIIMGLVVIFPATWCVYSIKVAKALGYSFMDVATDLPFYLKSDSLWLKGSLWGTFIGDVVKGYLFTGVAAIFMLPGISRKK